MEAKRKSSNEEAAKRRKEFLVLNVWKMITKSMSRRLEVMEIICDPNERWFYSVMGKEG